MIAQRNSEAPSPEIVNTVPREKKRLLLVTNREEMRRLRAILKPLDAHIDWAADPESGHTLLESPGNFDAVIVDDKLPAEGWRNVIESARKLGVKAPFLICTQKEGADRFLTESKTILIADLLVRPYDDKLVQDRVRRALEMDHAEPFKGATVPSHQ